MKCIAVLRVDGMVCVPYMDVIILLYRFISIVLSGYRVRRLIFDCSSCLSELVRIREGQSVQGGK